MSWIQFAIFGLAAGAIARLLHPGKDPMNWLWTMILGIAGAELGAMIAGLANIDAKQGMKAWIAAIGGSILLLVLFHFATGRRGAIAGPSNGTAPTDDYKKAVFDDLSRGPNG